MNAALIAFAAFSSVFLGCFQTINVTRGRHAWAVLTSLCQGLAALTLYRSVPRVETADAIAGFLIGGVIGGQLSMYITRKHRAS